MMVGQRHEAKTPEWNQEMVKDSARTVETHTAERPGFPAFLKILVTSDGDALPGRVYVQHGRCGKPNCRCVRAGSIGHIYYARLWRDQSGTQHKRYVRRMD